MRRIVTVVAAAIVAAAASLVTAVPANAQAARPTDPVHVKSSPYVALGDSYSSAAGVYPQVPGSPSTCSRSVLNYAHDIAAATEPKSFTDVTCSGAKTSDFFLSQAS